MSDDRNGSGPICGYSETTTDEPCQRPVSDADAYCYMHPPDDGNLPANHGAPDGNQNAVGNDGGPPEGNGNAVKHGLFRSLRRRVDALDEEQQQVFMGYVHHYKEQGVEPMQAASLASAHVLKEEVELELFDDLMKTIYTDAGNAVEVPKSDMMNAWTGFKREIRMTRHHEGLSKHSGGDSLGHTNLDLLIDGGDGD